MQLPDRSYKSAIDVYVASEMMFINQGEGNEDQVKNEIMQKWLNEPKSQQKKYHNFLQTSKKQPQQELHEPLVLPIYPLTPYEKFFIQNMNAQSQTHPNDYQIYIKREYLALNSEVVDQMKIDYEEECQNYLMELDKIIEKRNNFR